MATTEHKNPSTDIFHVWGPMNSTSHRAVKPALTRPYWLVYNPLWLAQHNWLLTVCRVRLINGHCIDETCTDELQTRPGWPTPVSFVTVLEAVSPCSRYLKVWFLWRPPSLAGSCTVYPYEALPLPLHGSVQMSSSHVDESYWMRKYPNDLISLSDLIKDPFSKSKSHNELLGVSTKYELRGGGTIQNKNRHHSSPQILAEMIQGEMAP